MKQLMTCKYEKCNKFLLDPIILPCSQNICKSHVAELTFIENVDKHFKCLACDNEHKMPHDGFISNSFITKLMNYDVHLNENEKKVVKLLGELKENIKKFEKIVKEPEDFICENVSLVRIQIIMERDRLIRDINDLSNQMLAKLQEYENECKNNLSELFAKTQAHSTLCTTVTNLINDIKEELRIPSIENTRIEELFTETSKLIKEIDFKSSDYKNRLLMNKECSFYQIKTKFNAELFGELFISSGNFYSPFKESNFKSFIVSPNKFNYLMKLCDFKSLSQVRLLYRATQHGFSSKRFHALCDQKENTLTIIKIKDNPNIFGGFCSVGWDRYSEIKKDSSAFIFSLINKYGKPFKVKCHRVYCYENLGPSFGEDEEIVIASNSNRNQDSYSEINGERYNFARLFNLLSNHDVHLAGSYYFTTQEIEVYQIY